MGRVQRLAQTQRWGNYNRKGKWETHVIDEGGNYKIGKRIVNPKVTKYADDPEKPIGSNYQPESQRKKNPVRINGYLREFVYFDQELHKTVRVRRDAEGNITKTPL